MSFYISKKDGKFNIDHSINDRAQFYVKFKSGTSYEVLPVNFTNKLPLGMKPTLFIEYFQSKNEYGGTRNEYSISSFFKNEEGIESEIRFWSLNPLAVENSSTDRIEKALLKFWEILNIFDTIQDVQEIAYTANVFEYTDSVRLSNKIDALTKIMEKYGKKLPTYLHYDILEWIKRALLRFGFSTQKLVQSSIDQFPNTVHLLNNMRYQVFKNY